MLPYSYTFLIFPSDHSWSCSWFVGSLFLLQLPKLVIRPVSGCTLFLSMVESPRTLDMLVHLLA